MNTHSEYIYGINAGFAILTANNSMKSLVGKVIPELDQEREKLACILVDVMNDHNEAGDNMLDNEDYYNASALLNLILGTAYSFDFMSV